jgi:hypothetical protein
MSIEPEDSLLEEALRGDLPSANTETRLRRRLLAAGLAVGNGIATTTAAAGTAGTSAATTGLLAKVAGLSWGLKLGLAAAVTIPTVGLILDGHAERRAAVQAPARVVVPAAPARRASEPVTITAPDAPAAQVVAEQEPERAVGKAAKQAVQDVAAPPPVVVSAARPSQGDFAGADSPTRAPQVASTLADETRLLDAAFAALAAGNQKRAAELIGEHEARYPQGLLTKERERAKARLSELSRGE